MHEQTIAQKIISDANQFGKVKSLTIEVGDLAHLPANEMKEVMEKLTDWEIIVNKKKATIACECGYVGEPKILQQLHDNNVYECPKCKHSLPRILDGHEITLIEAEVEDEDYEEEYIDETLEEE